MTENPKPSDPLGRRRLGVLWGLQDWLLGAILVSAGCVLLEEYTALPQLSTSLPAVSTNLRRHPSHTGDLGSDVCQGHKARVCLAGPPLQRLCLSESEESEHEWRWQVQGQDSREPSKNLSSSKWLLL